MKGKTKEEILELVKEKREIGTENLKNKIKNLKLSMNEPGDIKRFKEKQILYYKNEIHSLNIQIRRRGENMKIAAQLYNKNKIREELRIYKNQLGIETLEMYIKIYKEKPKKKPPKKKFVPPDPVTPILKKPEPIPLTPEEKKAIKRQALEAKIAEMEEEIEFKCPHCDRIYATEPSRKRHITMRHKED